MTTVYESAFRTPLSFIQSIVKDLEGNPTKTDWTFTTKKGSVLHVKRLITESGTPVLDFMYGDGD